MDHLWSPWRLEYVTGKSSSPGCVFCEALAGNSQADLIVFQGDTCFVILNLYPYNNGHLMVVPNRHIAKLAEATTPELNELIELTRRSEISLTQAYSPHGLNVGINLGKPAGRRARRVCDRSSRSSIGLERWASDRAAVTAWKLMRRLFCGACLTGDKKGRRSRGF